MTTAKKVITSKLWQSLATDKNYPELDIIHLDGHNLVRGTIDWLVERSDDRLLVIDYKTITSHQLSDPVSLTLDKNYHKQVFAYVKAIKSMHPNKKVNGGIYFTASNSLVLTHQEFEDHNITYQNCYSVAKS